MDLKSKIILIYGPTASGKSKFAIKLAKKISVRKITKEDIKLRNLPNQTTGLIITKIREGSPLLNSVEVDSIIVEAQKKKIKSVNDLNQAVKKVLNSNQKTILLVIYNTQNQRRYIGIKLN